MKNRYLASIPLSILAASPFVSCKHEKISLERPNIVFIITDDMNNYGFLGHENVLIPYQQALMKSSVTFTAAACQAPLCIPSRASFFTGIQPHNSGVYLNGGDPWNASEPLKQATTMLELFKENGYISVGYGKVYHQPLPVERLVKNFDNHPIRGMGFEPFPDEEYRVFSERDIFSQFWGVQAFPDSVFPDNINTERAIQFLNEKHDDPFFLTIGLWRPHTPFTAPQRFFDMYDPDEIRIPQGYKPDDLDDVPEFARSFIDPFGRFEVTGANNIDNWKRFIHGYYACTTFADWNIGRLVEALDNSDYADNTIVIVFTDNGFHAGTKNHWEKNTLWETSANTPLIVRVPGAPLNGEEIMFPVGLIDLYPTLVDICGLPEPNHQLDGKSLRPFLEKPGYTWDRPVLTSLGENFIAIRNMRYRYIEYPDGSAELYDHDNDPFEWTNLANRSEYASVIEDIKKHMPDSFMKALPGRRN
jgi:arylsulfatase A-like enzyme